MIRTGRVLDSSDRMSSGRIKVMPLGGDKDAEAVECWYCGPGVGGDAGLFSPPTPGSLVLFAELASPAEIPLEESSALVRYVYLGSIAHPVITEKGRAPYALDKNYPESWDAQQMDSMGRAPGENEVILDSGIPEASEVYKDNNLPQAAVWKLQNGHKIVMAHKITKEGTINDSILIQSKSGKRIHIDDQPPTSPDGGDRITVSDEKFSNQFGPNRIEIKSTTDSLEVLTDKNQVHASNSGSQEFVIMNPTAVANQRRENLSLGDIADIAYRGNHFTIAEKDLNRVSNSGNITETAKDGTISRVSEEGDIVDVAVGSITLEAGTTLSLKVGSSTITITSSSITLDSPTVNVGSPGLSVSNGTSTLSNGVVLDSHKHPGDSGGTTGGPQN